MLWFVTALSLQSCTDMHVQNADKLEDNLHAVAQKPSTMSSVHISQLCLYILLTAAGAQSFFRGGGQELKVVHDRHLSVLQDFLLYFLLAMSTDYYLIILLKTPQL